MTESLAIGFHSNTYDFCVSPSFIKKELQKTAGEYWWGSCSCFGGDVCLNTTVLENPE